MPSTRTICTLQYNPYSNREKKGYTTYTGYAPYVVGTFTGINFNPADGVNTELVLNTINDKADYCLVLDGNTIESRWFILDCNRTRGGQYQLQLYRDVVYDNLPEVMSATAFIEKGWINDVSNPLIFNLETLPTNQRKIDERLIKDNTGTPWIVGYMPLYANLTEDQLNIDIRAEFVPPVHISQDVYNIMIYGQAFSHASNVIGRTDFSILDVSGAGYHHMKLKVEYPQTWHSEDYGGSTIVHSPTVSYLTTTPTHEDMVLGGRTVGRSYLHAFVQKYLDIMDYINTQNTRPLDVILPYQNRVVEFNNRYYRITLGEISYSSTRTFSTSVIPNFSNEVILQIESITAEEQAKGYQFKIDYSTPNLEINYNWFCVKVDYTEVTADYVIPRYTTTLPDDAHRIHLADDGGYTMFCMPWNDFRLRITDDNYMTLPSSVSRSTMFAISASLSGSGTLMDLQLVPYCPLWDYMVLDPSSSSTNAIDMEKIPDYLATPIKDLNNLTIISYIFWCTSAKVDFYKSQAWSSTLIGRGISAFKIKSQTLKHRLCAPDKSSVFEYNPQKNIVPNTIGLVELNYHIICHYKPYKPFVYVEVESDASSLYGPAYKDGRGLLCTGDFSLPQIGDAWATYLILNKNYANIFNRQVESIELQNKYAKQADIVSAVTGTISGATSAATSGGAIGGVKGAIGAGIAGGIASAVGGIVDIGINETLRQDQLDLKKDLYQYNLENIQALPNTLLNVGALNPINKVYPYIEVYDCTETETSALLNKIKYNGMSIGVISEGLSNYIIDDASDRSFIKGQIIRIDLHDDYHMLKNIRQEFETGFFINRGGN